MRFCDSQNLVQKLAIINKTHTLTPSAREGESLKLPFTREGEFLDSTSAMDMKIAKTSFATTTKTLDCHENATHFLAMTRRGAIHFAITRWGAIRFAMTGRGAIRFAMTEILRHTPLTKDFK
ncbi:hypothetical protein ACWIUD_09180 [Helicobacter sp. 23-1044]